jgi:hypothetical protein
VRLLHTGYFEVFQDHLSEVIDCLVAILGLSLAFGGFKQIDQFIVPVDREGPVRRETLDGERSCNTDSRSRMVMPGATIRKPRENVLLLGCRAALTACHAMSIAMTVVLPAPVASLSARRISSGFACSLAPLRCAQNLAARVRVPVDREHRFRLIVNAQSSRS